MKKSYTLEDLDCAHCAAKMEDAIKKLDGVNSAFVNFIAQKLTVDADDEHFDAIMKQIAKEIKKIEPDCRVVM